MKIRVGVLQFDIALGDRERNRATLRRWLSSALVPSELPTAVTVPEIWDVGYALDRAGQLADPEGAGAASSLARRLVSTEYGSSAGPFWPPHPKVLPTVRRSSTLRAVSWHITTRPT